MGAKVTVVNPAKVKLIAESRRKTDQIDAKILCELLRLDGPPFLIRLSRAATRVVWQNIVFGVIFIVGMMTLAIWGPLTPVVAAVTHTGAALVVALNSARLFHFGEEEVAKPVDLSQPLVAEPAAAM